MRRLLLVLGVLVMLVVLALPPVAARAHDDHPAADYPYPHVHSLVRDPANAQHIYALGNPDAYQSFDGGQTWQPRGGGVPTAHYARLVFEPRSGHLFAYTPGIAGFHRSTDQGWNWPNQSDLLLRDVVARSDDESVRLLAVSHDLRFVVSDDGGGRWLEWPAPWSGAGDARLVQLPNAAATLVVVAGGTTYRSANGGDSWERVGTWPAALTPVRLFPSADSSELFAIAHHGQYDPRPVGNTLLRSGDGGRTWQAAPVSGTWAALGARGSVVVAATWRGDVWRYAGGGWDNPASWQPWPLALVQPLHLREDVNPTPTVTDLLPGPHGELVVSTVLGMYLAEHWGLPLTLRSRGLVPTAALLTAPLAHIMDHGGKRHFLQTGHMLGAPFLATWERLGGITTLGYPLTEPYLERSVDTGQDLLVQLFERGRLEQHADGQVQAARIVAETHQLEAATAPQAGCAFVQTTKHNVCGQLLDAWRALGGERWLGLPLAEARSANGVLVQLFERGRLEHRGTGRTSSITLGLVGREEAQRRGWLP